MASRDEIFTNKLFLNAVLPLIKVIASDVPSLAKKFEHAHGVMQVSALDPDSPDGKVATHAASGSFTTTRWTPLPTSSLSSRASRR